MTGTVVNLGSSEWDAANGHDRALLRGLINNPRWAGFDDSRKGEVLDALFTALGYAREDRDARAVASIARTIVSIDQLNQKDQHKGLDLVFAPKQQAPAVHIDLFVIPSPVRKRIDDSGPIRGVGGDVPESPDGGTRDGEIGPPA